LSLTRIGLFTAGIAGLREEAKGVDIRFSALKNGFISFFRFASVEFG
jgi:hypothetical protein